VVELSVTFTSGTFTATAEVTQNAPDQWVFNATVEDTDIGQKREFSSRYAYESESDAITKVKEAVDLEFGRLAEEKRRRSG
jgi:hypothetical protein